jgi:hypothetical protein
MLANYFTITRLLLAFSFTSLVIALFVLYTSWQSQFWPSVTGEISYSRDYAAGTINSHKAPLMTTNIAEVSYDFVVSDKGLYWGFASINKNKNYRPKDKVTVYYNPKNPSESTLHPGPNWVYFIAFMIVSITLAFSAFVWHKKVMALTRRSSWTRR